MARKTTDLIITTKPIFVSLSAEIKMKFAESTQAAVMNSTLTSFLNCFIQAVWTTSVESYCKT